MFTVVYIFAIHDMFGWIGNIYLHLFLSLEITFEALFFVIPIKEMMSLYHLYHEMDNRRMLEYAKDVMSHSLLDVVMKRKKISNKELSLKTNISVSTINALRYDKGDINKLEASKLLSLSRALKTKMETLLPNIHLEKSI